MRISRDGLIGDAYWAAGRPREAIAILPSTRSKLPAASRSSGVGWLLQNYLLPVAILAMNEADVGDKAGATATLALALAKEVAALRQTLQQSVCRASGAAASSATPRASCSYCWAMPRAAQKAEREVVSHCPRDHPHSDFEKFWQTACNWFASFSAAQASYLLGDLPAAESAGREAFDAHKHWPLHNEFDQRDDADISILLALPSPARAKPRRPHVFLIRS